MPFMYRVVNPDQTPRPPLTDSNFCSKSFVLGRGDALGSTFVTELTGVTGATLGGGFCAGEWTAKNVPMTAEAARGRSLRFIISSNTRNRVRASVFKYERAFPERQILRFAAWCKTNCPKGQVIGSAGLAAEGQIWHAVPAPPLMPFG